MKHILLLLLTLNIHVFAQGDFKKLMEGANQKFNVKSYKLAITEYDNTIKLVSADIDKIIAAKAQITPEKKYVLEPYTKRAQCFYFTNNFTAMKTDMETIAAVDTANADVKVLKAYFKHKSGDKINSCIGLRQAGKKGDLFAKKVFDECFCWTEGVNLANEGTSKNNLRKYDEALVALENALSILPDSGYIHTEKAKALLGLEKGEEALKELRIAVHHSKKNYKTYYLMGQIYNSLDKSDSAYECLTKAVDLSKGNYDVVYLRATTAEKIEQWNAAVFDLLHCSKQKPDDGKLYLKIAEIKHHKQNDLLGACDYYHAAANRGVEEAKEMSTNCNNLKYMKKNLKKDND